MILALTRTLPNDCLPCWILMYPFFYYSQMNNIWEERTQVCIQNTDKDTIVFDNFDILNKLWFKISYKAVRKCSIHWLCKVFCTVKIINPVPGLLTTESQIVIAEIFYVLARSDPWPLVWAAVQLANASSANSLVCLFNAVFVDCGSSFIKGAN